MGGYSTITQSPEEFPQEIANQMRRRGLIPALAGIQPTQSAGTNRVADDPVTRSNPEAYGSTTPSQSPTSASPSNPLTDKMWEEYNKLGQPEPAPPQPSLKQRLLSGLLRAAPIAAGAIAAGGYGARGAAQGTVQEMQREQGVRLTQQQMAQQHQQQRDSLRERMLQEILQQQRMEQQNQQFQQRESDTEGRLSQQIQARSDLETQTAKARDAETERKEAFAREQAQAAETARDARLDKTLAAKSTEDDKRLAVMMSKMGNEGTWSLVEDPNTGKPRLFNSKTGETRDAPAGVGAKGSYQKNLGGAIDAQNYAQDYMARGVFTGPGDEALQEKFFELAKPSTGFRMTQPQIDQLRNSRNWMNSVQGHLHHATTGTWFSDTQRQQIVATMNELAEAKKRAQAAQSGGGQPAPAQGNATDPLGILK